ncbi:MAG: DUF378 domain-containing protein [Thermoplasmata archaeon]
MCEVEITAWKMNIADWIAMALCIIGALIWLGIGVTGFNVIDVVNAGDVTSVVLRAVYVIVGLAGLWLIYTTYKLATTPKTYVKEGKPTSEGTETPST